MYALSKYAWQELPLQEHFVESIGKNICQECANIDKEVDWATPICTHLESGELPEEEIETSRIIKVSPNDKIIDGTLYKKDFSIPFVICVTQPEIITILWEVHEGYTACH